MLAPSLPTSFCAHFHSPSFKNVARHQELQCGGNWSTKVRGDGSFMSELIIKSFIAIGAQKQEELKWELESKLLSPPPLFFFFFFFVVKKMTMAPSSCQCHPLLLLCRKMSTNNIM
jgi:hypothetical protein